MSGGCFISFEGGEGAGKSTQLTMLARALEELGHDVLRTREPGGTAVGAEIRRMILDPASELSPLTEAMLFAADRAEHVASVIRPALERGSVVLTDRYVDSSVAYQGAGRSLDKELVAHLSDVATESLMPDRTFLLDIDPQGGLTRAGSRASLDRMELAGLEFHTRLRNEFLDRAAKFPNRFTVIDATVSVDEIHSLILDTVKQTLP